MRGFGPPNHGDGFSACSWGDHPVSGHIVPTAPFSDSRSLCLRILLKHAGTMYSLTHYAKGTPLQTDCHQTGFKVSFTPSQRGLFTFPSRYLFTIGPTGILRLRGWSPCLPRTDMPWYSSHLPKKGAFLRSRTGLSPFSHGIRTIFEDAKKVSLFQKKERPRPGSLATTAGISVDAFSSGYLDVSVPQVCFVFWGFPLLHTTSLSKERENEGYVWRSIIRRVLSPYGLSWYDTSMHPSAKVSTRWLMSIKKRWRE